MKIIIEIKSKMNSTAPIGQKQTGKLVQGRLANTMPADMAGKKRSLTATTKTIGKLLSLASLFLPIDYRS
jgi:hypothetical protein